MVTGTCYVVAHPLKANVLSGHRRGWFDMRDLGAVLDHKKPLPPSGNRSTGPRSAPGSGPDSTQPGKSTIKVATALV
jgi:hypothetical protein